MKSNTSVRSERSSETAATTFVNKWKWLPRLDVEMLQNNCFDVNAA